MGKAIVAAVATAIAVGVLVHERQYAIHHSHAYGPANVISVLALAVVLLGAIHVWSGWTEYKKAKETANRREHENKLLHYVTELEKREGREATLEERQMLSDNLHTLPDPPPWRPYNPS